MWKITTYARPAAYIFLVTQYLVNSYSSIGEKCEKYENRKTVALKCHIITSALICDYPLSLNLLISQHKAAVSRYGQPRILSRNPLPGGTGTDPTHN